MKVKVIAESDKVNPAPDPVQTPTGLLKIPCDRFDPTLWVYWTLKTQMFPPWCDMTNLYNIYETTLIFYKIVTNFSDSFEFLPILVIFYRNC